MVVVEQKHATAHRGEVGDGCFQLFSQFGTLKGDRRTRHAPSDAVFGNLVERFGVAVFLFPPVIYTDVFSNTIHPRVKRRITSEGVDRTKRFEPRLLCQVFGNFGVFDASEDVPIEAVVVFSDEGTKGFGVSGLCGRDEVFFVYSEQSFGVPFI